MSRKLLVSGGIFFCMVVAALAWHMNASPTSADTIGLEGAIFKARFSPNFDFHSRLAGLTDGQQFIVEATLVSADPEEKVLGTLYRVGTRMNDHVAVVQDVYDFSDCGGRIMAQGILKSPSPQGTTLLAVTGGVGVFRSARGELQVKILDESTGEFRAKLQETRVRNGEDR